MTKKKKRNGSKPDPYSVYDACAALTLSVGALGAKILPGETEQGALRRIAKEFEASVKEVRGDMVDEAPDGGSMHGDIYKAIRARIQQEGLDPDDEIPSVAVTVLTSWLLLTEQPNSDGNIDGVLELFCDQVRAKYTGMRDLPATKQARADYAAAIDAEP